MRIVLAAVITALVLPVAGAQDKDAPVSALELTKVYSQGAAEFDKTYKGKTITIEGVVSGAGLKDGAKSFLMIKGYFKAPISHDARCVETADFEGLRVGHKVQIRGAVHGHSEMSAAAELRNCKIVKVFADDFPPTAAVKEEVKKLQGKWKVLVHEANGKKLEGNEAPFTEVTIEGYNVYLHQGSSLLHFGLKLNLGKTPNQVDLVGSQATLPSIYALDGDMMQLYLAEVLKNGGFRRPGGFDTTKYGGILLKIERQK